MKSPTVISDRCDQWVDRLQPYAASRYSSFIEQRTGQGLNLGTTKPESFQAFQRIDTAAEIFVCDEARYAAVFKRYSAVFKEHHKPDALQLTLTGLT